MTLHALSFDRVRSMNAKERDTYFENFARYFPDSPDLSYAIRIGSKTFHSTDTHDLRIQFDQYLNAPSTDERK